MKKTLTTSLATLALMSSSLLAQDIDVKVVNNTHGIYFTPLLVSAHPATTSMFTLGSAASANLKAMAEGGSTTGLAADFSLENANNTNVTGLTNPGATAMVSLTTDSANTHLSIGAMMLPTNDGFIALNNWEIPATPGTYTININAYDAGTEANTEIITDIPADPGSHAGTGATGVSTTVEGYVHIHRGNIGDSNATGGKSDLDNASQRWLNPVAQVIVTVK